MLDKKTNKEEIKSRLDEFIKSIKNFSESEKVIPKIKSLFKKLTLQEFLKFINNVKERIENRDQIDIYQEIMILTNLEYKTIKEKIETYKLKEEIELILQKIEQKEKENYEYKETSDFKQKFEELRQKSEVFYRKENTCGPNFERLKIKLVKRYNWTL